jgi:hypothetical protein
MGRLISRAYNNFSIDHIKNMITKRSSNPKLFDEAEYLLLIEKKYATISCLFPRVLDVFQEADQCGNINMTMEYFPYSNLGQLLIEEKFDADKWSKIALTLRKTLDWFDCFERKINSKTYKRYLRAMYIEKTEKEFNNLLNKNSYCDKERWFPQVNSYGTLIINGKECLNFSQLWPRLKPIIEHQLCRSNKPYSIIHGDLCFSNILYSFDEKNYIPHFKFIDPRGSFGKKGVYGDRLYDLAKLFHSFEGGYEYIIYDQFNLVEENKDFQRDFICPYSWSFTNDNRVSLTDIFSQHFNEEDIIYARLIEGLIFIGMCARHYDSIQRQKVMYLTGVSILNDVYKQF